MNLKPGRELDALIAEKVIGLVKMPSNNEEEPYYKDLFMDYYIQGPYYSTDIAAAWEVVNKLSYFGSGFSLEAQYCGELGQDGFICKFADFNTMGWHDVVYADTAPHAICLAALKAVGVDV